MIHFYEICYHFQFIPKQYGEKSDLLKDLSQINLKTIQYNVVNIIEHWSPDGLRELPGEWQQLHKCPFFQVHHC